MRHSRVTESHLGLRTAMSTEVSERGVSEKMHHLTRRYASTKRERDAGRRGADLGVRIWSVR